jgi:hypothetical protein
MFPGEGTKMLWTLVAERPPSVRDGPARVKNNTGEYTKKMDYNVGSRVKVRLYSGQVVKAEITAITNQSTGRKVQIIYGSVTVSVNPAQIIEVSA